MVYLRHIANFCERLLLSIVLLYYFISFNLNIYYLNLPGLYFQFLSFFQYLKLIQLKLKGNPVPFNKEILEIEGLCATCKKLKYNNSSHCTICNECFMERNHHCLWLNNCISKSNFKDYYLLLIYSIGYLLLKVKIHATVEIYAALLIFVYLCYFSYYYLKKNFNEFSVRIYAKFFKKEILYDSYKNIHLLFLPFLYREIYLVED